MVRNISSMMLVQVANYLMPIISVPIVVRIIGAEKFGLINYAGAIVGYFVILINYGFSLTATRKIAQNRENECRINHIFNEVLFAKIWLFIISSLIFLLCYKTVPVFKQNPILFFSTFLICIGWTLSLDWFYQGMQDLYRTAIFNLVSKLLFTSLILILIKSDRDFFWQPLSISLSHIFVSFISFKYAIKKYNLKIKFILWNSTWKLLLNERMIFFSNVLIVLITTTTTVILGSLSNINEVAYYTAAQRLILIAHASITIPIAQSFFPYIGKAFGNSKDAGIERVREIAPLTVFVMFLVSCTLFCVGPWFISLFYGSQFQKSGDIFRLLAFIPFIISISNLYGIQTMLNLNMDKAYFKITSMGAMISLISNISFIHLFGSWAAAITWLVTEFIIVIVMSIYLKTLGIQIFTFESFNFYKKYKRLRSLTTNP